MEIRSYALVVLMLHFLYLGGVEVIGTASLSVTIGFDVLIEQSKGYMGYM